MVDEKHISGRNATAAIGMQMHGWATDLFPFSRSLTGPGTRRTLEYLQRLAPCLQIKSVPSGTQVFDWTVPLEWSVESAYVEDPDGRRVIDFAEHNLHLMGYSVPFRGSMDLAELQQHLHSLPEQPDAIPYVTSYYRPAWGFCLRDTQRRALKPGRYNVVIDSALTPGVLNYAEAILPGADPREVFLSTYVCHPSMANNELSGPVVVTALLRELMRAPRRFTYRVILIPETIGSLTYLSLHHREMKENIVAGFNVTCVGDERAVSFLPSRAGETLADRVAQHVLHHSGEHVTYYTYLDRGSDERQYCSPGIDLPVVSIMRSKYGAYPEYHTSLDDLGFVTPAGLQRSFELHWECLQVLEANDKYLVQCLGEPQLGRRGLYPTISKVGSAASAQRLLDILAYCDGQHDLVSIADILGKPARELLPVVHQLRDQELIRPDAVRA
jgi:aminopeptidase-like protein